MIHLPHIVSNFNCSYCSIPTFIVILFFYGNIEHLFASGMWVWIIATLVRDVCAHVELNKLHAATTVRDYFQKIIVPLPLPPGLATSSSIIPETQEHVLGNSPGDLPLIAPRKRTETAFLRNEKSERTPKRTKQSKIPPRPQVLHVLWSVMPTSRRHYIQILKMLR